MPNQATVFYSWQSDLPNKTNRGFIEAALKQALEASHKAGIFDREYVIDRDTKGIPGSPDIAATIFKKIDSSSIFVADVSIIATSHEGRPCPNPNVLIELGYAVKSIGLDNLVLVYNTAFGSLRDLPFDLRGKRIASFSLKTEEKPAAARQHLTQLFQGALSEIAENQRRSKTLHRDGEFTTSLVSYLVRIQLFGNEISSRRINPWRDEVSSVFRHISQWLRDHSHESAAVDLELAEPMEALALTLDEVSGHVHTLGGGGKFNTKVVAATAAAAKLQANVFGKGALSEEAILDIPSTFADLYKRLTGWVSRAKSQDLGRSPNVYKDFISAVSDIGYQLAQISYYPLDCFEGGLAKFLREIGETLHLIDMTDELYGRSRDTIVTLVAKNETELRDLIQRLRIAT